jgi:hypothetical protein
VPLKGVTIARWDASTVMAWIVRTVAPMHTRNQLSQVCPTWLSHCKHLRSLHLSHLSQRRAP